jgi:deoxyadenosine/deoxycytidine kinase
LNFRYLAIEGPPGAGKTVLAERLGARLDAVLVLDEADNPFLGDFLGGRPGAAFQAQLFSLLSRHRQQDALRQGDLFSQATVADYLFDRDKIYAYLNLDDNELFIYQRLYDLLAKDAVQPDLVVYLQAPGDVVWRRLRRRHRAAPDLPLPAEAYVHEVNEAFNHYFFHYAATPLVVVETSHIDPEWDEAALDELQRVLHGVSGGTHYYVPRTEG